MSKIVKISRLSLVNFKGVRSLDLDFSDQSTVICGDNGTGKTTVFDSFTWCLFGKDSTGRSDSNFNLKTLGSDGKPIYDLPHSVTLTLVVNGAPVVLQRVYKEIWTTQKGSTEKILKHSTDFFINGVACGTKKEYDAEVAQIISEDIFRMITNPFYFTSLKAEVQKQMLLDMAGNVSDDEITCIKPEFAELMKQLSGVSLERYAKEVASKKRSINDELKVIPGKIETARKLMPEAKDWEALTNDKEAAKLEIQGIDAQIADKTKIQGEEQKRKAGIQRAIGDKRVAIIQRENAIKAEAQAGTNAAQAEIKDLEYKERTAQADLQRAKSDQQKYINLVNSLTSEVTQLRAKFAEVNKEEINYDPNAFICPTCKRPLEVEDVEAKQQELLANFNSEKAAKLKAIQDQGKSKRAELDRYILAKDQATQRIQEIEGEIANYQGMLSEKRGSVPAAPDVDAMIAKDPEIISLKNEMAELENQLTVQATPVDVSDLTSRKSELNRQVEDLIRKLADKQTIERAEKEISDLEEKRTANQQALADLEKWELTALEFQKAKDAKLLERINGMFALVSFSFVDEQLNGGEKLTCVCTVNGTPYPDVNNAGKINAGLDIINAICRYNGVTAPIFVDNAESVNEILPTDSQKVLLYVSSDKTLTIK